MWSFVELPNKLMDNFVRSTLTSLKEWRLLSTLVKLSRAGVGISRRRHPGGRLHVVDVSNSAFAPAPMDPAPSSPVHGLHSIHDAFDFANVDIIAVGLREQQTRVSGSAQPHGLGGVYETSVRPSDPPGLPRGRAGLFMRRPALLRPHSEHGALGVHGVVLRAEKTLAVAVFAARGGARRHVLHGALSHPLHNWCLICLLADRRFLCVSFSHKCFLLVSSFVRPMQNRQRLS